MTTKEKIIKELATMNKRNKLVVASIASAVLQSQESEKKTDKQQERKAA